jgi:glycosyltransferase involved in cell wall biosynthesis
VKVSVILPVYNVANYLDDCMESLARQTLPAYEIIAVDDGSKDGSRKVLKK